MPCEPQLVGDLAHDPEREQVGVVVTFHGDLGAFLHLWLAQRHKQRQLRAADMQVQDRAPWQCQQQACVVEGHNVPELAK